MLKFLWSVVWGVAKIILITGAAFVLLFLIHAEVNHFLRYSVFKCVDKNFTFTDSEAISHFKKHIESELLGYYSYRHATISSDYNKISRGVGDDRESEDYGWGVSREDATYPFQADGISVEFVGSNSSYVQCDMLACGPILGCEAH
ncbi:hypothetical protein [Methylocystis sp.]|uniref:hypothetical protein n=1 Tax=Methylocystis sp. TaxID=1911079 RepID=UPI003DA6233F